MIFPVFMYRCKKCYCPRATSKLVQVDGITPDKVTSASIFIYITTADKGDLALLPSQQGLVPSSKSARIHPCCVVLPLSGVHALRI